MGGKGAIGGQRFRILTVCTGNICRSPLAEALLRRDLSTGAFSVSSAGTMGSISQRVPRHQLRIAEALAIEGLDQHCSRQLTVEMLAEQALVLGMSREHRRQVTRLAPERARQVFTLREFAELARAVTSGDVQKRIDSGLGAFAAAVDAVASLRGQLPPPAREDDLDIVDPFGKSGAAYRRSRDQLLPAAQVTAEFLNQVDVVFGNGAAASV